MLCLINKQFFERPYVYKRFAYKKQYINHEKFRRKNFGENIYYFRCDKLSDKLSTAETFCD